VTAVILTEADRQFAAVLRDLRQSNIQVFEAWLNGSLAGDADGTWKMVPFRISAIRRKFGEEYVTSKAPAVIDALHPGMGPHIVRQLSEFTTFGELPRPIDLVFLERSDGWHNAMRAAIGAALGAAAALLLFAALTASGFRDEVPPASGMALSKRTAANPPPPTFKHRAETPTGGGVTLPPPMPPDSSVVPSAPSPTNSVVAPNPDRRSASYSRVPPPTTLWIIIGAMGAAMGALLAIAPTLPQLVSRKAKPRWFGLIGTVPAITVGAVFLGGAGLVGRTLAGPAPWWNALLVIAAALAIPLVRSFRLGGTGSQEIKQQTAVRALEQQLLADSAIWSALSSGLVVGQEGIDRSATLLNHVRGIILAHRDRGEAGENILRIVEQELRLPLRPRDASRPGAPSAQDEFTWAPQCAEQYEIFGIVEPGDTVSVKIPLRVTVDSSGVRTVVQKGLVVRKT
jgi:hypothetical protein